MINKRIILPDQDNYGLIYCTTNLVSGKKYIGKLTFVRRKDGSIKDRKTNYLGSSPILGRAIRKYGKENFIRETLQFCTNKEDLIESERYWISYFDATKSNLFYNIIAGGTGGYLGEEAGKKMSAANKRRSLEPNWTGFKKGVGSKPYAHKISIAKRGVPAFYKRRPIGRLDMQENLLKSYDGICSAVLEGFMTSIIIACCQNPHKTHGGFKWKYLSFEKHNHGKI